MSQNDQGTTTTTPVTPAQQQELRQKVKVVEYFRRLRRWFFTGNHAIMTIIALVLIFHTVADQGLFQTAENNEELHSPPQNGRAAPMTPPPHPTTSPTTVVVDQTVSLGGVVPPTETLHSATVPSGTSRTIGSVCEGIKSRILRTQKVHGIPVDDNYGFTLVPTKVKGRPNELMKSFSPVTWCEYNRLLQKLILSRIAHMPKKNLAEVRKPYVVGSGASNTHSLQSCAEGLKPFSNEPKPLTVVCTGVLYASQHGVRRLQVWVNAREVLVPNGQIVPFLLDDDVKEIVGPRADKNIGGKQPSALSVERSNAS